MSQEQYKVWTLGMDESEAWDCTALHTRIAAEKYVSNFMDEIDDTDVTVIVACGSKRWEVNVEIDRSVRLYSGVRVLPDKESP